jgi:hypothetical protein
MYGNQLALQLPTRWFTFVVSAYRGADLREILGGQLTTNYTDTIGLTPVFYGTGVDNVAGTLSGFAFLGCTGTYNAAAATCSGQLKVAPEHGVRTYGGFVEVGLPISRWFDANPKGHNAGWQLFLHAGKDQLVSRDALGSPVHLNAVTGESNFTGQNRLLMGKLFAGTLIYKLNPFCSFVIEQSVYGARLTPFVSDAVYTIAGKTGKLWQDHRTEFGPVFTF